MVFKQQAGAHLYQLLSKTNYSSVLLVGWSFAKIAQGLHRLNECLLKIKQIPTGANLIPIKENTKRGSLVLRNSKIAIVYAFRLTLIKIK